MNDLMTLVLFSLAWPILLVYGVQLTNRKCEPFARVAHVASIICLLVPLSALRDLLGWTEDHVGLWVLAVIPAAVLINLILIWMAGEFWPHCKEHGVKKVSAVRTVASGTPDAGEVTIRVCPKCRK